MKWYCGCADLNINLVQVAHPLDPPPMHPMLVVVLVVIPVVVVVVLVVIPLLTGMTHITVNEFPMTHQTQAAS